MADNFSTVNDAMPINKPTLAMAQTIAARELARVTGQSERLSHYRFGPLRLRQENERFWTLYAGARELVEEGGAPGGIHICVDKADAHVWTTEELEQFYLNVAAAVASSTQPEAAAV